MFPGIITHAQIDYMLARMYALDVMRDEIATQGIRYDLLLVGGKPAGFASYGPTAEPGVVKLHKIYLLPELHGRGLGSRLLQHVEREVRAAGAQSRLETGGTRVQSATLVTQACSHRWRMPSLRWERTGRARTEEHSVRKVCR
jgi:GNAT superfamily N-acetyltransferase